MAKQADINQGPFLHAALRTTSMMKFVLISLLPVIVFGIAVFGLDALYIILTSVLAAVLSEFLWCKLFRKPITINDGSAVITGLLLALSMPPQTPLILVVVGACFAIIVVKQLFGGLGKNLLNPAVTARVLLFFAFPKQMHAWQKPFYYILGEKHSDWITFFHATTGATVKGLSGATPLEIISLNRPEILEVGMTRPMPALVYFDHARSYLDLFLGSKSGCIGEVSVLLILLGAFYLLYKRVISWEVPVVTIASFSILSWILGGLLMKGGFFHGDILFNLLSGSFIFAVIYMASDPVTTPLTRTGRIIFSIGLALITSLVRSLGVFPEGIMFGILAMNLLTPFINWVTGLVRL